MGAVVLVEMLRVRGLGDQVKVTSAGLGEWHIGERADVRTVQALAGRGYDGSQHRARLFDPDWFEVVDLVIALDRSHERALRQWAPTTVARDKVVLLRRFDPASAGESGRDLDVPDPYYDDDAFEHVLDLVEAACAGLADHLQRMLSAEIGRAARD